MRRAAADDPRVKALLGDESPESLADRLVAGSTLGDPAVRARLFKGGMAAVRVSTDPMIQFVLAHDADACTELSRYRSQVEAAVAAAQSRLAQARFAAYGDTLYPDATFTLRPSHGSVTGWQEAGRPIAPTTTFAGLYARQNGKAPYELPARWLAARGRLNPATVLDFSTSNDVELEGG